MSCKYESYNKNFDFRNIYITVMSLFIMIFILLFVMTFCSCFIYAAVLKPNTS